MRRPKVRGPSMPREDAEDALRTIMSGYRTFLAKAPVEHEDPKAFAAHHAAGRACLNHYQQLKDMTESGDASQAEFEDTLRRAQDAMAADLSLDPGGDRADEDGAES